MTGNFHFLEEIEEKKPLIEKCLGVKYKEVDSKKISLYHRFKGFQDLNKRFERHLEESKTLMETEKRLAKGK